MDFQTNIEVKGRSLLRWKLPISGKEIAHRVVRRPTDIEDECKVFISRDIIIKLPSFENRFWKQQEKYDSPCAKEAL